MKTAGVIVEYNPFHNGHYYHIQETKKVTGADVIVAVMSGNFLQRGEPALLSKWARTKMALYSGADLVIELPYVFATQKAEIFAQGAVSLLSALQVNSLCFGSEDGNITSFINTINLIKNNQAQFDAAIQASLQQGKSYPRAAADAFKELHQDNSCIDLSMPNNILGYHYIKAIQSMNTNDTNIQPYTITRTKANYHDESIHDQTIASATSIRKTLFADVENIEQIKNVLPEASFEEIVNYKTEYKTFHHWEHYFLLLKYRLLSMTAAELQQIYEVEEGIENLLLKHIRFATSFEDFMRKVKTKRYTWTRLQRICLRILTNSTKKTMLETMQTPTYIRLLGMSETGQAFLNKVKKDIHLPVISRLASFSNQQLDLDIMATNIFACGLEEPYRTKLIKAEYSNPPIRV